MRFLSGGHRNHWWRDSSRAELQSRVEPRGLELYREPVSPGIKEEKPSAEPQGEPGPGPGSTTRAERR